MGVGLNIQYSTEPAQPFGDARADRGRALADRAGENKGVKPLQRGREQAGVEAGAVGEVLDGLFCSQKTSRRTVVTRPIKGTRPRLPGMENALRDSIKDQAELNMIVDLERNDLGRVCRYGTVRTNELMTIERYSHVNHIVSNITGELRDGMDGFDLIRAVFPGGTITGVPKIRCMEIIETLEPVRRGPYTGSLGYISWSGDMDLNIIIRTLVTTDRCGYLQVGAGIVADSEPRREYEETLLKAEAVLQALGATRCGSM